MALLIVTLRCLDLAGPVMALLIVHFNVLMLGFGWSRDGSTNCFTSMLGFGWSRDGSTNCFTSMLGFGWSRDGSTNCFTLMF